YPSFSKAHSKESLGPSHPRVSPYTPDPTDIAAGTPSKSRTVSPGVPNAARGAAAAPPSPPLTADEQDLRRSRSGGSTTKSTRGHRSEKESGRRSLDDRSRPQKKEGPKAATSKSSLRQTTNVDEGSQASGATRSSLPSTVGRNPTLSTGEPQHASTVTQSTTDSDATSVAPGHKRTPKIPAATSNRASTPTSVVDSSPRTPTYSQPVFSNPEASQKGTPMVEIFTSPAASRAGTADSYAGNTMAPPPPPPPPPPPVMMPADVPRVDYLLQNGGLPHIVPRNLVAAVQPSAQPSPYSLSSPSSKPPAINAVRNIFAPFQGLLDDYSQVMAKSGSIAVATGYRSVARRLLDRLEAVFARNISSETCRCVTCRMGPQQDTSTEEDTGLSWGEILEYVSGRRELPPWPPFALAVDSGLGISGMEAPMQKLDVDVPEEYRDHYIRQSKKTKQAVQTWLSSQPEDPTSPPQEVDDETLTFAMLTHLEPERRPLFTALLRGMTTLPASRAPTPLNAPKPEMLAKTALALQRLYRLAKPPRDPECTMYLLNNPSLHGVLATMAAVSSGEWEILVSGRFDGFLWSGAEVPNGMASPSPRGPSRGPSATPLSRTTTPFGAGGAPSRGATPFSPQRFGTPGFQTAASSFGAPVQMDEEVEIATLAEVEREIYLGMEALEDAFEALHCKAEATRRALRERSAGLAMAAQTRRGSAADGIEVRLGTPASGIGGWNGDGWEMETDDGLDDARSELAPDDSASNISYNRRRKKGRRTERRTPAPVEEEDESDLTEDAVRNGKR
ncbi:hypothetical protein K490DRAFT_1282, partial [Saccharata proteae CBS 121410]